MLERVSAIDKPGFVTGGDSDPIIRPRFSSLLAGFIPWAWLKIYPDAAHGFLFKYHADFAAGVAAFLDKGCSGGAPGPTFFRAVLPSSAVAAWRLPHRPFWLPRAGARKSTSSSFTRSAWSWWTQWDASGRRSTRSRLGTSSWCGSASLGPR